MTDILADLAGMQRKTGNPCARVRIQRDHPDLVEAWDKAIASHYAARTVAQWFTEHNVADIGIGTIQKHRSGMCARCQTS